MFAENGKLVGVVYGLVGSPKAIQISQLKGMLFKFFPETVVGP